MCYLGELTIVHSKRVELATTGSAWCVADVEKVLKLVELELRRPAPTPGFLHKDVIR